MINHVARKDVLHQTGRHTLFGEGIAATNRARKATAKDIGHLITKSAAAAAHATYEDQLAERPSLVPRVDAAIASKVIINPQIISFIADAINKRSSAGGRPASKEVDDLRDQIMRTALDQGLYMESAARKRAARTAEAPFQSRAANETHMWGMEFTPKNYEGLKPPSADAMATGARKKQVAFEPFKRASKERVCSQAQQTFTRRTTDSAVEADGREPDLEPSATRNHFVGEMGTKNLRAAAIYEPLSGELSEREAHT